MCLEDGFDSHPENLAICVKLLQLVPESKLIAGEEELRSRRTLTEKHAALLLAAQELLLKQQEAKEEDEGPRRPSHPLLLSAERFSASTPKCQPDGLAGQKRSLEGAENENARNGNARQPMLQKRSTGGSIRMATDFDVDQKDGEEDSVSSADDDEACLEAAMVQTPIAPKKQLYHGLYQLDRMLEIERIRSEAMETAVAWLESESGKKMIAQVANVLLNEAEESITQDAAIALARRNYIEEQVKLGVDTYERGLPRGQSQEQLAT
jgi:hypothetical protein